LPAQGDHPLVDLHKVDALDAGVLHHFPHGAAVAAANDQDPARVRMAHERHVRDHLVIHELVLDRRLHDAVQNQHAAEAWRVDDRDVLIAAPFPVQHTADADADIQVIGFDLLQPKLQPSDLLFLLTGYIRYIPPVSCPQGKMVYRCCSTGDGRGWKERRPHRPAQDEYSSYSEGEVFYGDRSTSTSEIPAVPPSGGRRSHRRGQLP